MLGKDILKDEIILKHLQRVANHLEEAYNDLGQMKETKETQDKEEVINNIDKIRKQIQEFSQFAWEWSAGKVDMNI